MADVHFDLLINFTLINYDNNLSIIISEKGAKHKL
jgi:hypothetical protein